MMQGDPGFGARSEALIVLGAGTSQLSLLREVQSMGVALIGVDRDAQAPGFSFCTERIVASTHDADAVVAALEGLADRYVYRGIVTRSNGMPTVTRARVAEHFGLPGPGVRASEIAMSKRQTIRAAHACGIPAPQQYTRDDIDSGRAVYPMVLKPDVTEVGKKFIYLIQSREEFSTRLPMTVGTGGSDAWEAEQFVEGRDVLAIGLVRNGVLRPWLALREHVGQTATHEFLGLGFTFPAASADQRPVWEEAERVRHMLEIEDGVLITAFRIADDGRPHLIEIHLDLGGDFVMDVLVPLAMGRTVFSEMVGCFMRRSCDPSCGGDRVASIHYLYDFDPIDDRTISDLESLGHVVSVDYTPARSGRSGYVAVVADTWQEVAECHAEVGRLLGRPAQLSITT